MVTMRKPSNAVEAEAKRGWQHGSPAEAMSTMRAAGYDEQARRRFLTDVVGVKPSALLDLQLWRDSYLDWLAGSDHEAVADSTYTEPGYWDLAECGCPIGMITDCGHQEGCTWVDCPTCPGKMRPGRRECTWCALATM